MIVTTLLSCLAIRQCTLILGGYTTMHTTHLWDPPIGHRHQPPLSFPYGSDMKVTNGPTLHQLH